MLCIFLAVSAFMIVIGVLFEICRQDIEETS